MIACGTYVYASATTLAQMQITLHRRIWSALVIVNHTINVQPNPCCSIGEYEADNSMSIQNLAIVFAQLFGQMRPGGGVWQDMEMG